MTLLNVRTKLALLDTSNVDVKFEYLEGYDLSQHCLISYHNIKSTYKLSLCGTILLICLFHCQSHAQQHSTVFKMASGAHVARCFVHQTHAIDWIIYAYSGGINCHLKKARQTDSKKQLVSHLTHFYMVRVILIDSVHDSLKVRSASKGWISNI